MVMPDFVMRTLSHNENLMQASGRGAKSRSISAIKLIEMKRDELISIRSFEIAKETIPDAYGFFATDFLRIENCRTNRRGQLPDVFGRQIRPAASRCG